MPTTFERVKKLKQTHWFFTTEQALRHVRYRDKLTAEREAAIIRVEDRHYSEEKIVFRYLKYWGTITYQYDDDPWSGDYTEQNWYDANTTVPHPANERSDQKIYIDVSCRGNWKDRVGGWPKLGRHEAWLRARATWINDRDEHINGEENLYRVTVTMFSDWDEEEDEPVDEIDTANLGGFIDTSDQDMVAGLWEMVSDHGMIEEALAPIREEERAVANYNAALEDMPSLIAELGDDTRWWTPMA